MLVTRLVPGGQGEKIGLKTGDILLAYDGRFLQTADQLIQLSSKKKPQTPIKLTYLRDGKTYSVVLQGGRIGAYISSLIPSTTEVDSLISKGNEAAIQSRFQDALQLYQKALTLSQGNGYLKGETYSRSNLGIVYRNLGQFPLAIDQYEVTLKIFREIDDQKGEAASLSGLGNVYTNLGKYPQAIEHHQASLSIDRKIGDREGEAASLNNLGNVYRNLKQHAQALDCYKAALKISREIPSRKGEAANLGNLGLVYFDLDQYLLALEHQEASLKNKAPRCKQRGINCAPQSAGFQPAFAPRGGELNPQRLNAKSMTVEVKQLALVTWAISIPD